MVVAYIRVSSDKQVLTTKDRYELSNNINAKVLAFSFSLSAEIEQSMISQRTKEALARKKAEGKKLGRPRGRLSRTVKLTGKEKEIQALLDKQISMSSMGRIFEVHWLTVKRFIDSHKLREYV